MCFWARVAGSIAVVLLTGVAWGASQGPERPNLIFFLADDLGWRDLGCYGSLFHRTPQIDALARRGTRFTQAYAANPLCSPTRASVLTGLWPARIGITAPVCHLKQEILQEKLQGEAGPQVRCLSAISATRLKLEYFTLAEALHEAGYATGHFGKWHLGHEPYDPLHQGFDVDFPHWPGPGPAGSYVAPWKFPTALLAGEPGEHIEDRVSAEVVRFIQQNRQRPFYVNYWCFSVHSPWDAKKERVEKYRHLADRNQPQRNPVYAAMIESLDDAVGRVVRAVEEEGLMERTIFVFFSDNGGVHWHDATMKDRFGMDDPPTSNLPLRGGKATLYEGGTRVPCLVVWPGVTPPGSQSDALVQSIDFYPTLLEMLGLKPRPGQSFDGISFVPALKGRSLRRNTLFCHFPHQIPATGAVPGTWVRQGDWKLIRCYADNDDQTDRLELYDLRKDLAETTNLVAQMPDKARELNALIDTFLQQTGAVIPKPNPAYDRNATALAALGWQSGRDLKARLVEGQLVLHATGGDPMLITRSLPEAQGPFEFSLRMKSSSKGPGQVFWTTGPKMPFHRDRSVTFTPQHDGSWREYRMKLDVSEPIQSLRLDPSAGPGEIRIEWMRLTDGRGRLVKEWSFRP